MWTAELVTADVELTRATAAEIGRTLAAGDVLLLTGELGAGKTTFTQGLGVGLGVRSGIISPTFVLVRIHPSITDGPQLVHVDAYRLTSAGEIDDLDLESTLDTSVTVIEWGEGRAEHLSPNRLHIHLARPTGGELPDFEADDDEPRTLQIEAFGPRWEGQRIQLG
ncbi:hypothetical protein GCM10009611_15180 [Arthrobacter roseus]